MISKAPSTNTKALLLPSVTLTFAAVILINPGGKMPIIAATNPDMKGRIMLMFLVISVQSQFSVNHFTENLKNYLILKRIYVIALLISKYCFS